MIYILDFDGVIFNDEVFKKDFQHVFTRYSVAHNVYKQSYEHAKEAKKGTYELDTHLKIIASEYPMIDHAGLRKDLMALARRSRHYIFADAKTFFLNAQKKQIKLFLISAGDPVFQKEKINASGIFSFFQKVIITAPSQKSVAIDEIKKQSGGDEVIFIDDKKEIVEGIKKRHPQIRVAQMARSNRVPRSKRVDRFIKDFSELY